MIVVEPKIGRQLESYRLICYVLIDLSF